MITKYTISKRKKINRSYRRIETGEVLFIRHAEYWDWLERWVGIYGDVVNKTIAMELLEEIKEGETN